MIPIRSYCLIYNIIISSFIFCRREIKLTSVLTLKSKVENDCNLAVRDIVANITFVGCIDQNSVLVQHSTNLYLFRLKRLMYVLNVSYARINVFKYIGYYFRFTLIF